MEEYSSAQKPRLSRILISVGLILQAAYRQKLSSLLSARARGLQIYRAAQATLGLALLAWFVWWLAVRLGFPADAKTPLKSQDGWQIARGLGLLIGNCVLSVALVSIGFWIVTFVRELGVLGRCQDELEVLRRGWASFNLWAYVGAPTVVNLVTALMG